MIVRSAPSRCSLYADQGFMNLCLFITLATFSHFVAAWHDDASSWAELELTVRTPPQPHILFILADDLGYNELGFRQNSVSPVNPDGVQTTLHKVDTPNIDRLAREGVILDRYYVQSVCTPSRAGLMTGRYPFRYGLAPYVLKGEHTYGLPASETTIAQLLSSAGYSTHMVGKWHLGHADPRFAPTFRGFQSFLGFLGSHQDYSTHSLWGAVDFRESTLNASEVPLPNTLKYNGVYSTEVFVERAQAILDQHDPSKPLFLFLSFQSVHSMRVGAPKRFLKKYSHVGKDDKRKLVALAMINALDEAVGKVEAAFKTKGMWEDTVLVFSTDNGGSDVSPRWPGGANFPLRGAKFSDYEGGIRGIGFVRGSREWPVPPDSKTMELVHITDWFPTLAHIAGAPLDDTLNLDGYNAWDVISRGLNTRRTSIVVNVPSADTSLNYVNQVSNFAATIIHERFKLMVASTAPGSFSHPSALQIPMVGFEPPANLICGSPASFTDGSKFGVSNLLLFDVVADPWECTNLAGEDRYVEKVAEMLADMMAHQREADVKMDAYAMEHCEQYVYRYTQGSGGKALVWDAESQNCEHDEAMCAMWPYKPLPEDVTKARCGYPYR